MATSESILDRVRDRPPTRVFTVMDGMILVAASAFGCALAGLWHRELSSELPSFFFSSNSTAIRSRFAGWAMSVIIPATLGWLALRSRQPRPRLSLLSRRPGAVACGMAALMLSVQATCLPLTLRTMGRLGSPFLIAAWYWPEAICAGVLASWVVLMLGGRWKVGDDWVDRSGTLIGACWIALPVALAVVEFV